MRTESDSFRSSLLAPSGLLVHSLRHLQAGSVISELFVWVRSVTAARDNLAAGWDRAPWPSGWVVSFTGLNVAPCDSRRAVNVVEILWNTNVQDPSGLVEQKGAKVNNSSEYDKSAKKWVGGVKEPIRMDLIIFLGSGIQVDAKSPRPETRTAK